MTTHEQIQIVADKIAKEFHPEKIILFGSYAWGTPTEDSDVDLMIVKETEDTEALISKISLSCYPRPFPMDILVYQPRQLAKRFQLGDFFIQDVLQKGKVLHG